ncbi:hypothetical protein FOS14_00725 [Skermania sp. ID1734]|uniref:hypothetical protein n=1 Tax=Skermania sp. ID1734 TaxID=2597516 RepID=UPI00117F147A|nr:hypothetical protein [Skermania sp. ID1734]TSE01951.1 hypothetical protein FOS14_00725 [Skermania sp. ID1734]
MTDSEVREAAAPAAPITWISYEEFGAEFFRRAVTIDRISNAVNGIAGRGIKIGPIQIGLLAGFRADGDIGQPKVRQHEGDQVAFDVEVPAALVVTINALGQEVRIEVGVEIDLEMHARAADPLLIVIDIPSITDDDVRLVIKAEALGAAWQRILAPMGESIRREVATRINAMLRDPGSVNGRVFDIAQRINDTPPVTRTSADFTWIDYGEFGRRFFREAVTRERIQNAVADMDGREISFGPLKTGPKEMVTVRADGAMRLPKVSDRPGGEYVSFDLLIPIGLDMVISAPRDNHYEARIDIPLVLNARAAAPLSIVIDVVPVQADDISIDLTAKGFGAHVLGAVGGVKKQLREQVAATVRDETADPSGRIVDVAERVDNA